MNYKIFIRCRPAIVAVVMAAVSLLSGCGQKSENQTPAQVKASMGGNYPPNVTAQGRASLAAENRKAARAIALGNAAPAPAGAGSQGQ